MRGTKATGYKGAGTASKYRAFVEVDGVRSPINFAERNITRIEIAQDGKVLSTENGGVELLPDSIKVKWGMFDLPPMEYQPTCYAYQGDDDKEGTVLFGPERNPVKLTLIKDHRV